MANGVDFDEANVFIALPVDHQIVGLLRRLFGPMVGTDAMHIEPVDQRPGKTGNHGQTRHQIAVGIDAVPLLSFIGDVESQFHPFVMGQFPQEGRIRFRLRRAGTLMLQIVEEFLGDFREQRGAATMPAHEIAHQGRPVGVAVEAAEDGKIQGKMGIEAVEEQFRIQIHAPAIHPCGRRMGLGVADVVGKPGL